MRRKTFNFKSLTLSSLGFTLIELLVVISVIAILAGLALPALRGARIKAMKAKAKSMIASLQIAMSMYETDFGSYPKYTLDGSTYAYAQDKILELLTGRDRENSWEPLTTMSSQWNGPYLDLKKEDVKKFNSSWYLIDPWGTPYVISVAFDKDPNTNPPWHNVYRYDIYSLGPDRTTYGNLKWNNNEVTLTNNKLDGDSDSSTADTDPRHDDINNW